MDAIGLAYHTLRDAAKVTTNRGAAAGPDESQPAGEAVHSKLRYRARKEDGTLSNTNHAKAVHSGIIGHMDRSPRFPYCRTTAYTEKNPEKYRRALPLIKEVDAVFEATATERYAAQKEAANDTPGEYTIEDTAFTTVTLNKNFRTALHKDAGDFKEGYGVMTFITLGAYGGYELGFPAYGVAIDPRTTDVVLANVHEWHANCAPRPTGKYERLSCVFYYRAKMRQCGTQEQEKERAKDMRTV